MAQYCRYCEYAYKGDPYKPGIQCEMRNKYITLKHAKQTNKCTDCRLNPIDVLRKNANGYKPTGRKIVQFGGLGKQVTIAEVLG